MLKIFQKCKSNQNTKVILSILDQSAESFVFPMLDNGYSYLCASRLSLFRSDEHWAIVFEIFGFSPRAGHPDLSIITISNKLHDRNKPSDYVSEGAYNNYLKKSPYWDVRTFWPISNEDWIDEEDPEFIIDKGEIILRDKSLEVPLAHTFESKDIFLKGKHPAIFELCRYLAHDYRETVLATEAERRTNILPEMSEVMQLDEWYHPDLANGQLPSQTNTFQQLANILESNSSETYFTNVAANNHWTNWPEGGSS
jgi:hypothetical protein